jgi:phospholipase C
LSSHAPGGGPRWRPRSVISSVVVALLVAAAAVAIISSGTGTPHGPKPKPPPKARTIPVPKTTQTISHAPPLPPCAGGACNRRGIHKIRHVVIIMQENRSFDSYFGTYPGADGIPMKNGVPTVCIPDPTAGNCVRPYHDRTNRDFGGPHGFVNNAADVDGGRMDGFVAQAEHTGLCDPNDPSCGRRCRTGQSFCTDVMGYHTADEIPNYWDYARKYVLQDHMFNAVSSWSLPAHLYEVSAWSAYCPVRRRAMECVNDPVSSGLPHDFGTAAARRHRRHRPGPFYNWTDLTYLLHRHQVSWRYYVTKGQEPDCQNDSAVTCRYVGQNPATPGIWNPLPHFATVRHDHQLGNIQGLSSFFTAARRGRLPAVSWIVPNEKVSEHPPALISAGQAYVTSLINAIMRSKDWWSTAIFLSWDDWGGFYDHLIPPRVDINGYGIRVPGLVISPYAKKGYIDHQTLSSDAYLKFIEDDFLHSHRIDPRTDGRPDRRPDVRENAQILGDLRKDFNFHQRPREPTLLPLHPPFS